MSQSARGIDERIAQSRDLSCRCIGETETGTPTSSDELRAIDRDGHRRVLAVVTSAYPSYSSCRQYRENLFDAAHDTQVQIDRIRHYANHPGFVERRCGCHAQSTGDIG